MNDLLCESNVGLFISKFQERRCPVNKNIQTIFEKTKKCKGFPVVLLVLVNGHIKYSFSNIKAKNKKKTDYRNHAEFQM